MRFETIALAALAVPATAIFENQPDDLAFRFIEAFRGTWLGLNRGLYKRGSSTAMNPSCLDDLATHNFLDGIHLLGIGDATGLDGDFLTGIGQVTYFLANLNNCNFRQPFVDINSWCTVENANVVETFEDPYDTEPVSLARTLHSKSVNQGLPFDDLDQPTGEHCTWSSMLDNTSKNAFVLMGKASNFFEVLKEFPADSADQLHAECLDLSEDIGSFIRVALGFVN